MKKIIAFYALFFSLQVNAQNFSAIQNFTLPKNCSIRALNVLNDSTVWFAGNKGVFGFTENAGLTWQIDSIRWDTIAPEFRSLAVLNSNTVLMINVGSPARIIKTTDKGKTWKTVYRNNHKDIFFDSMKFIDDKTGYALADPIDSCFVFLKTTDGGESWTRTNCNSIPNAAIKEACFASSNSCIDAAGKNVWFATGGSIARVFQSSDGGNNFTSTTTNILHGSESMGIYSIDFFDSRTAAIGGGDYNHKDSTIQTLSIYDADGNNFKMITNSLPFVSCIQFHPTNKNWLMSTSLPGIYFSKNGGLNWNKISDESFYTFRFSSSGKTIWFAGNGGRIGKMNID